MASLEELDRIETEITDWVREAVEAGIRKHRIYAIIEKAMWKAGQ